MAYTITSVLPLALDTVKVTVSSALITNTAFFDVSKYAIYLGNQPNVGVRLSPKLVLNKKNQSATAELILCVPGLTSGQLYTLVLSPQTQSTGLTNAADITAQFVATTTKLDSLLDLIPSAYDKSYTSKIRELLLGFAIELDDVAGPDKEYYV